MILFKVLLWTSPLCLVTSFWMVLSTGVTGGGGGGVGGRRVGAAGLGGMWGFCVGAAGFLVGTWGFWVGTAVLRGGGVTLFGGSGAFVDDAVVVAVVDLGKIVKILLGVTGVRRVVVVRF